MEERLILCCTTQQKTKQCMAESPVSLLSSVVWSFFSCECSSESDEDVIDAFMAQVCAVMYSILLARDIMRLRRFIPSSRTDMIGTPSIKAEMRNLQKAIRLKAAFPAACMSSASNISVYQEHVTLTPRQKCTTVLPRVLTIKQMLLFH